MTSPKRSGQLPSELELMAYFDGELEAERRAEVEAFLASGQESSARARQKLEGLSVLSAWVRFDAAGLAGGATYAGADARAAGPLDASFTDELMARVLGGDAERGAATGGAAGVTSASPGSGLPTSGLATSERPSSGLPTSGLATSERPSSERPSSDRHQAPANGGGHRHSDRAPSPGVPRPANDNRGLLWGLVAVAAAAAAGMFFWGKAPGALDDGRLAQVTGSPSVHRSSEPVLAVAPSALPADASDDETTGVEIAAVDFGSASGAIYYVPKSGSLVGAATTTVVWLADE